MSSIPCPRCFSSIPVESVDFHPGEKDGKPWVIIATTCPVCDHQMVLGRWTTVYTREEAMNVLRTEYRDPD